MSDTNRHIQEEHKGPPLSEMSDTNRLIQVEQCEPYTVIHVC